MVMRKSGIKRYEVIQRAGRRRAVEQTSCFFSSRSTSFGCVISSPSVISRDTHALTSTPTAGTASTYKIPDNSYTPPRVVIELHPIISAAHVDSAKEPNRSAPMPAMSPTLSPTLSAMVAGLRGLSSGNPLSIFPTKSEPRSAALVKMPPPTRAKRATVEPPSPKPATASNKKSKYLAEREESSRPRSPLYAAMRRSRVRREAATRAKPMTTPARQARRKALPSELRAQMVVLKLERVAMCIPKAPQAIDVPAPTKKAKAVYPLPSPSTHTHTIPASTPTKTAQLLYSERINSDAPSWMMAPISTMPSAALKLMLCSSSSSWWLSPIGTFFICVKLAHASAAPTPTANTINTIKIHINIRTLHSTPITQPNFHPISPSSLSLPPIFILCRSYPPYLTHYYFDMEEEAKSRSQLVQAGELFARGEYAPCRKVLSEVKGAHASSELNLLLCDYKEAPHKAAAVAAKLMDILTALNIKLYEERPKLPPGRERAPRITHELYYWNIAVLAQTAGLSEVAELIGTQVLNQVLAKRVSKRGAALHGRTADRDQPYADSSDAGRDAKRGASGLLHRPHRAPEPPARPREEHGQGSANLQAHQPDPLQQGPPQTRYRPSHTAMLDGSRIMFNMRFQQNKDDPEVTEVSGIPISVHRQLLAAEIQYHAGDYQLAIRALGDLLPQTDGLEKNRDLVKSMIDHNTAIVLANYQKSAAAQLLLRRSLTYFTNAKELTNSNERCSYIARCKENLVLAGLIGQTTQSLAGLYESLRACGGSNSYKFNYRKAQVCLKYYHELLASPSKILTYCQIRDSYETLFFHPNQPYFQQKNKNKNPSYTNGRSYHRRYLLPNSHFSPAANEQKDIKQETKEKERRKESKNAKGTQIKKEQEEGPGKTDSYKARLIEALDLSEWYLKQALSFLEKEKSIIVNLEGEEKGLTEQVNERLYSQYLDFKASILSLLCYVSLCHREWTKTIHYATIYQDFQRQYQLRGKNVTHQQTYYTVLTHKMEAQCELGRTHRAYDIMQDIAAVIDYTDNTQLMARSTNSQQQGQAFLEPASQYANFCLNIAVLHSRDNKIPEAYQAIQKLLQLMRISPSSPQARLPLALLDLLLHYNLRTSNQHSALQLLKRRRILNVPGVIPQYQPILSVTK